MERWSIAAAEVQGMIHLILRGIILFSQDKFAQ